MARSTIDPVAIDPATGRRPRKPDGRRARTSAAISAAASKLFFEQGVARTTVDEIANAAGVSVGSIYVHFGNKEALYLTLVERALEMNERYVLNRRWDPSPLRRLMNTGEAYVDFALDETAAFRLVAMRTRESSGTPEIKAIEDRIDEKIQQLGEQLINDARAAMEAGEINQVPLENVLVFLWGAWSGVISLHLREDGYRVDPQVARETLRIAADVLVRGLAAPPA